ncbi:MAG: hypothetical protein H7A23_15990 [Leptospiraceae bacterium]|nr:hypothetical protein [Leptospiraceae bacterium]MCP5496048.1 hypothetical protein [Leptospiraceae bacterium]
MFKPLLGVSFTTLQIENILFFTSVALFIGYIWKVFRQQQVKFYHVKIVFILTTCIGLSALFFSGNFGRQYSTQLVILVLLVFLPYYISKQYIRIQNRFLRISGELDKINELSKEINANNNIDYILHLAFKYVEGNYNVNSYWLQIVDKKKQDAFTYSYLFPTLLEKEEESYFYYYRTSIPKQDTTSEFFNRRRPNRPFYYNDVEKESPQNIEKKLLNVFKIKSIIQFPLLVQGEYIAILNFMSINKYMNLNRNEIISLVRIAEQIAVAIKNSILLDELTKEKEISERARKELESISQISKLINANTNLDMILTLVYKHISSKYKIEFCALYFVNTKKKELELYKTNMVENISEQDSIFFMRMSLSIGIHQIAYKKKKIVYIPSVSLEKFSSVEQKVLKKLGIKSLIIVPLLLKEEVIGLFDFYSTTEKIQLAKSDIIGISNFCNQISGSINNSHLLQMVNESKRLAERSLFEIQKLNELTKTINSNIDLDIILLHISTYLESFFGISTLWLQLVDYRNNELYTYNLSTIEIDEFELVEFIKNIRIPINANAGVYWNLFTKAKPLYLRKIKRFNSYLERELVEKLKYQSILIVPLVLHGKSIGIFNLTCLETPLRLTKKDIKSISRFVEQIVGAIHNSTLLKEVQAEKEKTDNLLLNILPAKVAEELKETGIIKPVSYGSATIMFTDFKGFTRIASKMTPEELLHVLDSIFLEFDRIVEKYNIEKLKTIGDSYMCAGGIPEENNTHPIDICLAAMELQNFVKTLKEAKEIIAGEEFWDMRIGIHTGPVVAGAIGRNKFAYDVWGDTVNIASRMETNGEEGMINISKDTYEKVKMYFDCDYRGKFHAKNKGMVDMYFLRGLQKRYVLNETSLFKNKEFKRVYEELKRKK